MWFYLIHKSHCMNFFIKENTITQIAKKKERTSTNDSHSITTEFCRTARKLIDIFSKNSITKLKKEIHSATYGEKNFQLTSISFSRVSISVKDFEIRSTVKKSSLRSTIIDAPKVKNSIATLPIVFHIEMYLSSLSIESVLLQNNTVRLSSIKLEDKWNWSRIFCIRSGSLFEVKSHCA